MPEPETPSTPTPGASTPLTPTPAPGSPGDPLVTLLAEGAAAEPGAQEEPAAAWPGVIDSTVPRAEQAAWHEEVASLIPHLPADVSPGILDHAVRVAAEFERTWHSDATSGAKLPDPADYEGSLQFVEHMWGADFKANQAAVSKLIQSWGPKAVEYFSTDIGNRPGVLTALLELSKGTFKLSAAEAQAQIAELTKDPTAVIKGGKQLAARLRTLYKLAEGKPAPKAHVIPTPAPATAPGPGPKGESLQQLQAAILNEKDKDVRTRLIAELRAIYQGMS